MTSAELKSDLLETLDNILSGDEGFRVQPNTVCDLLSDAMKERYDDMDEFDQQYQEMVKFFTLPRQIKYIKQEYKSRIAVMAESVCIARSLAIQYIPFKYLFFSLFFDHLHLHPTHVFSVRF